MKLLPSLLGDARVVRHTLAVSALALLAGCVGSISDDLNPGGPGGPGANAGGASAPGAGGAAGKAGQPGFPAGGAGGSASGSGGAAGVSSEPLTTSLRLPRLSHRQWARTAQAFLKLSNDKLENHTLPDLGLRGDPSIEGTFETDERRRVVDGVLAKDYQAAADLLVGLLLRPEFYGDFVAEAGGGDLATRLRQLVATAWPRAFRRPLAVDEIERYVGLGLQAPGVAEAGNDDEKMSLAVQSLVRLTLLSPHFIYRVELGDPVAETVQDGARLRPLTTTEYATRLSYVLLDAPPDQALLAQASQLATEAGRKAVVAKLLEDGRAGEMLTAFHRALYRVDSSTLPDKDPSLVADLVGWKTDAIKESERFLAAVDQAGGGLRELMLSRKAFVNRRMAELYGLPADGLNESDFVERELPPERAGILTRVSWNGSEASAVQRGSILRGVYIQRKILCGKLGEPPATATATADALKPPDSMRTNREFISFKTSPTQCQGCHEQIINPLGFAFEHFDAIGRYVTEDNGAQVDSSGHALIDGEEVDYQDARGLLEAIATSSQGHACYAGQMASWVLGRPLLGLDRVVVAPIGERSRADSASSRAVLTDLLTSLSFRSLVVEEP